MAEPPDQIPAAAGRGHLRASHADREHAIEMLKAAYVQGMLGKDELDARVGRALTSRTCAGLAALTADIPPSAPATRPKRPSAPARRRPLARAAAKSGGCLVIAFAVVLVGGQLDNPAGPNPYHAWSRLCLVVALYAVAAALGFLLYGIDASVDQRRSRRQLPPRPGPGGHAPEGERYDDTGPGPVPPGPRTDQTRTDLRAHKSPQRQRHTSPRAGRAPRGARPAPGAV